MVMENSVRILFPNLLVFLLNSMIPHNLFIKKLKQEIKEMLGIGLEEKCKLTENVLMTSAGEENQERVFSFLKKAVRNEKEQGSDLTVIKALIEFLFSKLTEDQKLEAESELLSTGTGNFFKSLLIDILKFDETLAKVSMNQCTENASNLLNHPTDKIPSTFHTKNLPEIPASLSKHQRETNHGT